ncbi:unnamed protein product [Kluyveromyces dobzhanskii CBS 2104]|uniref:WGS project CCBQ000000000 data, contig 00099 n=1 Tax=Kluyveromyces dobzhanskii CBS 2104 TaxID=1427455 RepID=A0A0A8L4H1_9SACH|nr:unnamed protein product [Kluyveromyces dobzhanskii CBS 2104]
MSRASKITLGLTSLFTVTMVVGVHYVQQLERETLHQGPIKDAKRVAEKRLEKNAGLDPEKERQKLVNKNEHEYQLELRKKYEQMQPLSGEVRTQDNELIEPKN